MNTNNQKPEIEMLKQESAPVHLKARIVKAILDENKSKNMTTKKIIGFGLPAIALGVVAFGAAMAPKTALADPIAQTRDAFEAAQNYHMTTYQVIEGQRKRISESWVNDGKRTTFAVGEDGTMTYLDDVMIEVQGTLSAKMVEFKPAQVASGWTVQRDNKEVVVTGQEIEIEPVTTEVYEIQLSAVPAEKFQITLQPSTESHDVFEVRADGQFKGQIVQLQIMPFVDAEMSIEALQKLLEEKDLWNIEPNQMVNGRQANRYKLKESFMDFTVFVNPRTKLPILTRQTLHDFENKTSTTTEVEYDYIDSVPPTLAAKPTDDMQKK